MLGSFVRRSWVTAAIVLGIVMPVASQSPEQNCGMRKYFVPAGHTSGAPGWDGRVSRFPFEDGADYVAAAFGFADDKPAIDVFQAQVGRLVGRRVSIQHDRNRHWRSRALWVVSSPSQLEAARSFAALMVFGSEQMAVFALGSRQQDECVMYLQEDLTYTYYGKIAVAFGHVPSSLTGSARGACIASVFLGALGIHFPARFAAEVVTLENGQITLNERGAFLLRELYTATPEDLRRASFFLMKREEEFQRRFCRR